MPPCPTLAVLFAALVASSPAPPDRGPRDLVIAFGGDVAHPTGQHDEALEALGARAFDPIRPWLDAGDLRFVNVEHPFTVRAPARAVPYPLVAPPHRLDWLLDAGFNLISLGNNHVLDAGLPGLADTLAALSAAAAPVLGAIPGAFWGAVLGAVQGIRMSLPIVLPDSMSACARATSASG